MRSFVRDTRFAVRQLRKNPGFTLVTILTLALGIGATTCIFSLVNAIVLRPLPFPEQDRLVEVQTSIHLNPGEQPRRSAMSYPDYFDYRAQNHTLENVASYHESDFSMVDPKGAQHVFGAVVSANLFRTLRVAPMLGRDFSWDDEKPQANVAILSHQLWQSQFSGAQDIVGRAVTINGRAYTVVGVMPAGFTFPIQNPAPLMWTTLADDSFDPEGGKPASQQRGAHFLFGIGRLKPGVSVDQAQADLNVIAKALAAQFPDSNTRHDSVMVRTSLEALVGKSKPALRLLFAAVGFVLLIACANVAGLLLARSAQRRGEIAVRSALGASRWEIVRQVLVESVVLALIAGALGILLSYIGIQTLVHLVPKSLPRLDQVSVDSSALLFAIATSIMTGILFGVLPAWRMSKLQPAQSIRVGSRTVTADRTQHKLQNALVIAETAIGLVLLVGSGLLIHTFMRVLQVNPGFDAHNVLTADVGLSDSHYTAKTLGLAYQQLMAKIAAIPGVEVASAGSPLPMSGQTMKISFGIEGHNFPEGSEPAENVASVMPGYFDAVRIPLMRGRTFTDRDIPGAQPVVVITDQFAKRYFPNEDPVGKHIKPGLGDGLTTDVDRLIVGVVGDVKMQGLTAELEPQYYVPFPQGVIGPISLVVRTHGDPNSIIGQVREAVASIDSTAPVYGVHTLESNLSQSAAQPRFQAVLLSCFGGMALVLFAVGLYAVLSYTVAQRTSEIGIRMALGARREDMLRMFLNQGLRLTAIGAVVGLFATVAVARVISSMLYGVTATDPSSYLAVIAVLGLVALTASAIPARRAMQVDPMSALKDE